MRQPCDEVSLDKVDKVLNSVSNGMFSKALSPCQLIFRYFIYIKNPSKIPAATAEPMTPATFGPMACISR